MYYTYFYYVFATLFLYNFNHGFKFYLYGIIYKTVYNRIHL